MRIGDFSYRIRDLELRSCNLRRLDDFHDAAEAEIVKWEGLGEEGGCFTLAYWVLDKEGFYLKFVGNRPFDESIDGRNFWHLAKVGQGNMDREFEMMEEEEE